MIKLEVEITDNEFKYSYEVGESRQSATRHLCADSLATFTDLLRLCYRHFDYASKEREREILKEVVKREITKEKER